MSKFSRLAERIRSLPDLDKEKERLTLAKVVSTEVGNVRGGLVVFIAQAPHIDALVSGGMVEVVRVALSKAAEQSKRLEKLIQRESFGPEQKISEHLENIKKIKDDLEKERNKEWGKVGGKAKPINTILSIASSLNLESVASLRAAAENFKAVTAHPPLDSDGVHKIKAAINGCEMAIANSGLKGNVEKLLEGAIEGNGDPKLLLDDEVQQFFKDHPKLWGIFKLKLA